MIIARDCDPLRRFAWSRLQNWGLFTIFSMRARPSAEIRAVEVQKLRTFYDFCGPRATSRFKNCGLFTISAVRARPSAKICVVEVQKLGTFLRFLACARDPLRRFAWSRFQKLRTFYDFCGPRASLCGDPRGRGEVQKLRTFYDFCKPRATLCGDRACRSALAVAPCEFVAREMAFGSCLVACAPAFAIPRSWSAAAPD